MRVVRMEECAAGNPSGLVGAIAAHDVRDPAGGHLVVVRKGARVTAEQARWLAEHAPLEVHLIVPDAGDVAENDAALRLARSVVGPRIQTDRSHFGQVTLRAGERGLLRIDPALLADVNSVDGVLVFTVHGERPVDVGQPVGATKCAPLVLPSDRLAAVERLVAARGSVIRIEPFLGARVGFLLTDRVRAAAQRQAVNALHRKLGWFGSELAYLHAGLGDLSAVERAFRQAVDDGAELLLAAGGVGTDPVDRLIEGFRKAGGCVEQMGLPADPGTACWIGIVGGVSVIGLASCELVGRPGVLDLLLPWALAGHVLNAPLARKLALGGFLGEHPPRIPTYGS